MTGQTVSVIEEDCYNGVTPTIDVAKFTNLTDGTCPYIIVGDAVVWTYAVTNTSAGAITIDTIVLTDDAGTPLIAGDDFHPAAVVGGDLVHNIGDTHNLGFLDTDETWQYTFTAPAWRHRRRVFQYCHRRRHRPRHIRQYRFGHRHWHRLLFRCHPDIDIVKMTNGTDDLCPVVSVGSTVTWTYAVENTGNVTLGNLVISDGMWRVG